MARPARKVPIPPAIGKALNRTGFVDIETKIVERGTVYLP